MMKEAILQHLTPLINELKQLPCYGKDVISVTLNISEVEYCAFIKVHFRQDVEISPMSLSYNAVSKNLYEHKFNIHAIGTTTFWYRKSFQLLLEEVRAKGLAELVACLDNQI